MKYRRKPSVRRLRREDAAAPCREVGHDMHLHGGRNAGCDHRRDADCYCSVPVYVCRKCGDSDYGDNHDASEIMTKCAEEHGSQPRPLPMLNVNLEGPDWRWGLDPTDDGVPSTEERKNDA